MQKGFTIVELMVSISIIIILSAIGLQTLYISQTESRLDEDVSQIVIAIRKSQNSALAPSKSDVGIGPNQKLCSVGIRLIKASKTIRQFYTTNENNNTCSDKKFYGQIIKLQYASVDSLGDLDFEFNIPLATTGAQSVRLKFNNLEKEIQATDSGLIKVE